jgi:hypothetical protein
MTKNFILLFCFLSFCSLNIIAQPGDKEKGTYSPQDTIEDWGHSAYLWRGFEFTWDNTNHRIASFGSLVKKTDGDSALIQNMASFGTHMFLNNDYAQFVNHITYINDPDAKFTYYTKGYTFKGKIDSVFKIKDSIPIENPNICQTFINGIEMVKDTNEDAKKISLIDIKLTDLGQVCNINIALQLRCSRTNECYPCFECTNKTVNYIVRVAYLTMCGVKKQENFVFSKDNYWSCLPAPSCMFPSKHTNNKPCKKCKFAHGRIPLWDLKRCSDWNKIDKEHKLDHKFYRPKIWRSRDSLYYKDRNVNLRPLAEGMVSLSATGITHFGLKIDSESHLFVWSQFVSTHDEIGFMTDANNLNGRDTVMAGLYFCPWILHNNRPFTSESTVNSQRDSQILETRTVTFSPNTQQIKSFKSFSGDMENLEAYELTLWKYPSNSIKPGIIRSDGFGYRKLNNLKINFDFK